MKKLLNRVEKLKNKLYVMYIAPRKEKTFSSDGADVHYLEYRKRSRNLIVVFSAYNDNGPRYDYISSLSGFNASRLYIKDDFVERTGNYYLGRNGQYNIEKAVFRLIGEKKKEFGAQRLIFVGSSKGGYAAVNFGTAYEGSAMIVAAPQYRLGEYMYHVAKKFRPAAADVLGEPVTDEKIDSLNHRLENRILNNAYGPTQRVYMHCSVRDNTYEDHVADMTADLKKSGAKVVFDKADYEGHGTLKYYFPEFLKKSVRRETEE